MRTNSFYATYAGIGSRETPDSVLGQMYSLGEILAILGYTMRSGGAPKADTAFQKGCEQQEGQKEIYLPWDGFNGNWHNPVEGIYNCSFPTVRMNWAGAFEIAEKFHPAWHRLNDASRKLMARNSFQVLGPDLETPVLFEICYTTDGKASGGTGQAIRIAHAYNIPVYNLYNKSDVDDLIKAFKE